jgi:integrase-like protein
LLRRDRPSRLADRQLAAFEALECAAHIEGAARDHGGATERGRAMTGSNVRKIVARAGSRAGLPFPVHPHMFRHACGYKLENDGQDTRAIQQYLGHRNMCIQFGTPSWRRIDSRDSGRTEAQSSENFAGHASATCPFCDRAVDGRNGTHFTWTVIPFLSVRSIHAATKIITLCGGFEPYSTSCDPN